VLAGVTAAFVLLSVPFALWQNLLAGSDPIATSAVLIPAGAESAVATLFAARGGAWPAFGFRAMPRLAGIALPVLPRLSWPIVIFLGLMGPAVVVALNARVLLPHQTSPLRSPRHPLPGWLIGAALILTAFVWFDTGLLGVQPSLVSGGSMEPNLRLGDLVVTR